MSETMGRLRPGLVSITFRHLSPREIVERARACGLEGVEWGGDVHVPHGDLARASEVAALTRDAGLAVAAYGSYYRLAQSEAEGLPFQQVLDTAVALGAPLIRVWAGGRGSAETDEPARPAVVDDALRIGELAVPAGITVAYEYHGGTLTDTVESAERLLSDTAPAGLRTLWQPLHWQPDSAEANRADLRRVLPYLTNLHVYHWLTDAAGHREARPLSEAADAWQSYLRTALEAPGDHWALLEFVPDGSPDVLAHEASALREILRQCSD